MEANTQSHSAASTAYNTMVSLGILGVIFHQSSQMLKHMKSLEAELSTE